MWSREASLSVVVLLSAGCTSSAFTTKSDPFVGNWSCTATSTTDFSDPPNLPSVTETTSSTVAITDDGSGNLTVTRSPIDAGPICTLRATLNSDGQSSTLASGQSCNTVTGATVTYTSGTSTMNGANAYSSTTAWNFKGTTVAGHALIGTGSATVTCNRM